ncbi:MAG: DNA recombination protein RmuC [Halomonas sp.]|uniref:DNA recombination protein RmuC n=1 Tax=Halomonas sp. TaxID=1486246 RepID=UPI003F8E6FF2
MTFNTDALTHLTPYLPAFLAWLIGGLCGWLLTLVHAQRKRAAQDSEHNARIEQWRSALSERDASLASLNEALHGKERSEQLLKEHHQQQASVLREQLSDTSQALETLRGRYQTLSQEYQRLTTTLEQKEAHFRQQHEQLDAHRAQLRQEFANLANEVLEQKGKAFGEMSEKNINGLLKPIHSEIQGFREKIERLHHQDTQQHASLRTELQMLQQLNREITNQASRLSDALQGQKKIQGNWGELMLENVLEGSGLRAGTDYRREPSFNTEDGRRRPDAIVYMPRNRHLVIDAKTSLVAYVRYVNADDELSRSLALAEHSQAVSDRINELADKHYYDLPGLNSPDVVIMFIPVESAYVAAMQHDESLFQRAIERNVLVATPTTLLTSLNIVRQLWRHEDQSRHSIELARRAERLHTKLRGFLESMQDVGKRLDGARNSYDKAMGQLMDGKGNLIKQADEFRELGVSVRKELPPELVERAQLELSRHNE